MIYYLLVWATCGKTAYFKMAAEVDSAMLSAISFSVLPDVVILNILNYLPLKYVVAASCVCKRWKEMARSELIWKKLIPFAQYIEVSEGKSAYEKVSYMWKNSLRVGEERWYCNPLPELVEFESKMRKAELRQLMLDDHSTMTLMLRLNPCYPYTTKGKDQQDPAIDKLCETLWEMFGFMDDNALEITSHHDVLKHVRYISKEGAMESILRTLQPYWFVDELKIEPYELDEDGRILNGGGEREEEEDDNDDDDDDDDEDKYNAWKETFNEPLSLDTYKQVKAIFADKSENFIEYYLSDGCFNENDRFAHSLVISDTAVYHIQQIYDL